MPQKMAQPYLLPLQENSGASLIWFQVHFHFMFRNTEHLTNNTFGNTEMIIRLLQTC